MKIGFFDSGLGGILIMKEVAKALPEFDYEYYGDTANLPYGDKSEAEIYELTKAGVQHLFKRDCALVILACNTASAETLRRLQHEWLPEVYPDRTLLGVIIPMVEEAIASGCTRMKLLATKRTISSGKYHLELGKRNEFDLKLEAVATPELVPLLEAGNSEAAVSLAKEVIGDQSAVGEGEGVILGCTHYVLLKEKLREYYGKDFVVLCQDEIIPAKLKLYLDNHPELCKKLGSTNHRNIFLTEHRGDYDQVLRTFLEGQFIGG